MGLCQHAAAHILGVTSSRSVPQKHFATRRRRIGLIGSASINQPQSLKSTTNQMYNNRAIKDHNMNEINQKHTILTSYVYQTTHQQINPHTNHQSILPIKQLQPRQLQSRIHSQHTSMRVLVPPVLVCLEHSMSSQDWYLVPAHTMMDIRILTKYTTH